MALIPCPECGKLTSSEKANCFECGQFLSTSIRNHGTKEQSPVNAKSSTSKTNWWFLLILILGSVGLLVFGGQIQTYLEVRNSTSLVQPSESPADDILNGIKEKYKFSRFVDTWGVGSRGLFIPEEAWNSLSESQRQVLINYAQSRNLKAINVGKQLGVDNMSVDRTVWGS